MAKRSKKVAKGSEVVYSGAVNGEAKAWWTVTPEESAKLKEAVELVKRAQQKASDILGRSWQPDMGDWIMYHIDAQPEGRINVKVKQGACG